MQGGLDSFSCPVCGKSHSTTNGIENFPKNEYIIEYIRRNQGQGKCETHGKELSLLCTQAQCNKPICQICLLKDHAAHVDNVVDIAEDLNEKKEWLTNKVNELIKDLPIANLELTRIKEEANKANKKCIATLESQKKETIAVFDAMIKKISAHNQSMKKKIGHNTSTFLNFLIYLESIQGTETVTYQETQRRISLVNYIESLLERALAAGESDGAHFEYSCSSSDFRKACGSITKRKTCVDLDEGNLGKNGNCREGNNLDDHDEVDVEGLLEKRIKTEMPPPPPPDTWKSNAC